MSNIAVIPARGGSKRIPHKNIVTFLGKPMIAWTIEAALKSEIFDKVLVSTEDHGIAEVSINAGAEVPFLRQDFYDDASPISLATVAALQQAECHYQTHFDNVVQLMPNCPLRSSEDIEKSFHVYCDKKPSSQISVFKYGWSNPWWALRLNDQGDPEKIFDNHNIRSQDLPELFCPTGAIWIAQKAHLLKTKDFYAEGWTICELPWISSVDIDDYTDLEIANVLGKEFL